MSDDQEANTDEAVDHDRCRQHGNLLPSSPPKLRGRPWHQVDNFNAAQVAAMQSLDDAAWLHGGESR